MKKLLSLLSVLTISGTAVPTAIAASPYQKQEKINLEKLNKQKKQVKRQVNKKYKSLGELIINFDLGELRDNYEDTILHAIERLNPTVNSNEIRIVRIPNNSMALIAWSHATNSVDINDDVVWVQFSISPEGMVGNSNFYNGSINSINHKNIPHRPAPTPPGPQISPQEIEKTIQNKLNQLKKQVPKKQNQIEEQVYETVLPKNHRNNLKTIKNDQKEINIVLQSNNLSNILIYPDLGELPNNRPETILNAVINLNPNIIINEIETGSILQNRASIIPTSDSQYIGTVIVNFTINQNQKKDNKNQITNINSEEKNVKKLNKFIKMNDSTKNSSPCNNSTTKIGATIGSTAAGALAGSIFPGIGTLIGAGVGALIGGGVGIASIELACKK